MFTAVDVRIKKKKKKWLTTHVCVVSEKKLFMTKEKNHKTLCSVKEIVNPGCTESAVDSQKKHSKK